MCSDQTSCSEILAPTSEVGEANGQELARGVVLAAEPGPSGWRNADIAANRRSEGGPTVPRDWIGTWTQATVPHSTAKLWTAASIGSLDCGPKKPEPGTAIATAMRT